jgi:hypothetical protein
MEDMRELKNNYAERVWYSFKNHEIEPAAELVFRQLNVEHKGH